MQDYRLYMIRGGHIQGVRELQAADDASAIALADAARGDQPAELWLRARRVHAFEVGDGPSMGQVEGGMAFVSANVSSAPKAGQPR